MQKTILDFIAQEDLFRVLSTSMMRLLTRPTATTTVASLQFIRGDGSTLRTRVSVRILDVHAFPSGVMMLAVPLDNPFPQV